MFYLKRLMPYSQTFLASCGVGQSEVKIHQQANIIKNHSEISMHIWFLGKESENFCLRLAQYINDKNIYPDKRPFLILQKLIKQSFSTTISCLSVVHRPPSSNAPYNILFQQIYKKPRAVYQSSKKAEIAIACDDAQKQKYV